MSDKQGGFSIGTAYLLWGLSFLGPAGVHRLYLRMYGTGVLWLCTVGFFGFGTLVDLFRLPRLVREANLRLRYRDALFPDAPPAPRLPSVAPRAESVEHAILRVAKRNKGPVAPSEVALESETSIDQAKSHLDKLVEKGFAELRVRKSGQLVYVIPDFLDKSATDDFEDF